MKNTLALLPVLTSICLMGTADAANLRIIGGDKVSLDQYPYMAGLVARGQSADQVFCGAAVINQQWIMTAAHCVSDTQANGLDVIIGADTLSSVNTTNRFQAAELIVHPQYNNDTVLNDIALIRLSTPTSASSIKPAADADAAVFAVNQPVSVAGWGNLSTTGESFPDQLHAVDLQITDFNKCSAAYDGLASTTICAAAPKGGKDSCQGDSGGPLVARTEKGSILVGIVSFGDACASDTHPGVYTRVSSYKSFINNAMNQSGVDPEQVAVDSNPSDTENDVTTTSDTAVDTTTDTGLTAETDYAEESQDFINELDETNYSENTDTVETVNGVEIVEYESFNDSPSTNTAYAIVDFYNNSDTIASVTNAQISSNQNVFIEYDGCASTELASGEFCFIELAWNKAQEESMSVQLNVDISNNAQTLSASISLDAQASDEIYVGAALDIADTQFFSTDSDQWEIDQTDAAMGDLSLSSELEGINGLDLMGLFNEEDDFELEFDYQLDGATCYILVNGEVIYELAASPEWQKAKLQLPADAEVVWNFRAKSNKKSQLKKIRIDNLSKNGITATTIVDAQISAIKPQSNSAETTGITQGGSSGAGSTGLFSAFIFLLVALGRRVTDKRAPATVRIQD